MDVATRIFRFIYRWKWWLTIFPVIAFIAAFYLTKDLKREYTSKTVIYTGVISGYNLESSLSSRIDIAQSNNQMENFLNIIHSYSTLQNVSIKLYAQHMVYGDTINDTKYIWASHFAPIYRHAPANIKNLIDRNSYDRTVKNLLEAEKSEYSNYLYGLFMWDFSYYGKNTLEGIKVSRVRTSDMIEITYTNDDPNVVYNTLLLLNDEFLHQYSTIRDEETDKAIEYFEGELARTDTLIKIAENDQKRFSIANRIINYEEQTKQMAFVQSNFEIRKQEAYLSMNASQKVINDLEKKFGRSFEAIKNNEDFINRLNVVSNLSNQMALTTIFQGSDVADTARSIPESASYLALQKDLNESENDLYEHIDDYSTYTASGEVLISKDIALSWLEAVVQNQKAKEELEVLKTIEDDIAAEYVKLSPIGIYLKQQERLMSFLEKEYMTTLDNLQQAKLRKKNTQMSAANLKVMTPPQLPLNAEPTKRKYYVAGAGIGTFAFILGILLLMEILGRTLRDRDRTERFTNGKVIAALPGNHSVRYRKYYDEFLEIAVRNLSNNILNKIRYKERNIVNIISFSPYMGKSQITNALANHWNTIGRKYRIVNWEEALNKNDREIMYPINYNDLLAFGTDKIILIEHRDISHEIIQREILQNAIINILVLDSRTSWKDTDAIYYHNLVEELGPYTQTLFICLTEASKLVVEEFTGQLPPYNFFTNLSHDIYNFGNTSNRR